MFKPLLSLTHAKYICGHLAKYYIATHRLSFSLIVTHDLTESIAAPLRMTSSKPDDLSTSIDTRKQTPIDQNTKLSRVNQYQMTALSIITVMELCVAIMNIFLSIFINQADIIAAKVSHYRRNNNYWHIRSNSSMYNIAVSLLW